MRCQRKYQMKQLQRAQVLDSVVNRLNFASSLQTKWGSSSRSDLGSNPDFLAIEKRNSLCAEVEASAASPHHSGHAASIAASLRPSERRLHLSCRAVFKIRASRRTDVRIQESYQRNSRLKVSSQRGFRVNIRPMTASVMSKNDVLRLAGFDRSFVGFLRLRTWLVPMMGFAALYPSYKIAVTPARVTVS